MIWAPAGEVITHCCNQTCETYVLDCVLLIIPPDGLFFIFTLTKRVLIKSNSKETKIEEVLKFFGIRVLTKQSGFQSIESLLYRLSLSNYFPSPLFWGDIMPLHRFDTLWKFIHFSDQQDMFPEVISYEMYCLRLIDYFVKNK